MSHHDASLALDPTNPFDSHAIAVWIKDQHVGYVPRDEAKLYGPLLRGLADEGKHLVVPARVWIRRGGDRIYARVTLDVPSWSQTRTEHWLPVEAATYSPAAPTSEVVDPWMKGGSRVDVVGERYRTDALKALFRRIPADDSGAKSLDETAVLVPDPDNPYRLNSIAVFVKGHHVGDVATVAADQLYKPLVALADGGKHIGVRARARLWQSQYSSVEVSLDPLDPRLIHPVNDLPDEDHILIPAGSRIQVTKEEHHLDVLNEYTDPAGPTPVAVTLHEIYEERPRSVFHAVEVRLREQRVGILSPVQSKNLLPLVLYVAARGKVAVARAVVEGTKLKAEVVLNAVKAQDADHDWLESLGPETQEPARARRPDFDWDDDDLEPV